MFFIPKTSTWFKLVARAVETYTSLSSRGTYEASFQDCCTSSVDLHNLMIQQSSLVGVARDFRRTAMPHIITQVLKRCIKQQQSQKKRGGFVSSADTHVVMVNLAAAVLCSNAPRFTPTYASARQIDSNRLAMTAGCAAFDMGATSASANRK